MGKIETEGGVVGWGEGTLEGHTEAVQGSLKDCARRLIGWDAMNIEDVRLPSILLISVERIYMASYCDRW